MASATAAQTTSETTTREATPAAVIPITVRELLALAMYDRTAVLIGLLVPIGLAAAFYLMSPTLYDSTARLLVLPSSDYAASSPLGNDPSLALDASQIVSTEVELITNRSLLQALIERLGMAALYPDLATGETDAAILRLQRDLTADPIFAASVIRLRFRHRDPRVAAAVLEALLRVYLEQRARVLREDVAPVARQENGIEARLHAADEALYRFGVEHGIADLAEQRARLLRLQSDLTDNLREAGALVSARGAELAALQAQRATTSPMVPVAVSSARIADVENAKTSLLTLTLRRRDLVARLLPGNPLIGEVDQAIASVNRFIAGEPPRPMDSRRDARNPLLGDIDRRIGAVSADRAGAQARVDTASAQIAAVGRELAELNRLVPDYERLVGLEKTMADSFAVFVPRAEEARITDLVARARPPSVRIIDSPSPPVPVAGAGLVFVLLGLAGGAIGGLAATFLRSSLRETYVLPVEAQRDLDWPLLLTVNRQSLPGDHQAGGRQAGGRQAGGRQAGGQQTEAWR